MLLTKELRRQALDFATELTVIAARAPDVSSRRMLYKTIRQLQRRFGYSKEQKRQVILKLIENGAATIAEFSAESGISRQDVYDIVTELVKNDLLTVQKFSASGIGRPSYFYTINEKKTR